MSDDCVLLRDIEKDEVVNFTDVKMPPVRLRDELWLEQSKRWPSSTSAGTNVPSERRSSQFAAVD